MTTSTKRSKLSHAAPLDEGDDIDGPTLIGEEDSKLSEIDKTTPSAEGDFYSIFGGPTSSDNVPSSDDTTLFDDGHGGLSGMESTPSPADEDLTDMVEVFAGESRVRFTIHKKVLTEHSSFFKMALSGPWVEAQQKKVELFEVHPAYFKSFVNFAFSGAIDTTPLEFVEGDMSDEEVIAAGYQPSHFRAVELTERLVHSWVKGDFLGAPDFQNKIMDILYARVGQVTGMTDNIPRYVWEKTIPGSILRRLVVDYICADFEEDYLDFGLPMELENEIFRKFVRRGSVLSNMRMLEKSGYHVAA